jgi:hypothetical protein
VSALDLDPTYKENYDLFVQMLTAAKLTTEFPPSWLQALERALPKEGEELDATLFPFFATFVQRRIWYVGNTLALGKFINEISRAVAWVKGQPRGPALARKLSQQTLHGPLSALLEIFAAWRISTSGEARLVELEPVLLDGRRLDAKFELLDGQQLLIECFASMTTDLATSGKLDGFWGCLSDPNARRDPVVPKIMGKVLDKAEQAASAPLPVVVMIAPSADFVMPPEKIPLAISRVFADARSAPISAVALTGGTHPYFCESIGALYRNPAAIAALPPAGEAMLWGLGPAK